jgi:hypothetical protein
VVVLTSVAVRTLLLIANDDTVRVAGRLTAGAVARLEHAAAETDRNRDDDRGGRPAGTDVDEAPPVAYETGGESPPVHYREATAVVERAAAIRRAWGRRMTVVGGRLSTVAVLGVVFGGLVLATSVGAGERWVRLLPPSAVDLLRALGTLETLRTAVFRLVQTALVLLVGLKAWNQVTVSRVRRLGDSAGYAAGPLLAVGGLTLAAPALVRFLRETTALHYVLLYSRGGTVVSVGDSSFILYLDPARYTVVRSTSVFQRALANVVDAVGALTLAIAPLVVVLVLVLVVCCGLYVVSALFAPPVRTGTALAGGGLFLSAVLALVAGATPLWVVLTTPAAFYCWHLRRNPPTLARQVDPAANTRRGEAIYATVGGGYLFGLAGGVVGLTLLSRRLTAGGESWRLLVGVVLTAGVTLMSLVVLRMLGE